MDVIRSFVWRNCRASRELFLDTETLGLISLLSRSMGASGHMMLLFGSQSIVF